MKGIDMFCSSPASTAIIHTTIDQRSMLRRSRSTKTHDHDRRKNQNHFHQVPCLSQLPINPIPYFEKHRKSSSSADKQNSTTDLTRRKSSVDSSSRRYLLDDAPFIDWVSESNKILVPQLNVKDMSNDTKTLKRNDSHALTISSTSSANSSKDQVFLLSVFIIRENLLFKSIGSVLCLWISLSHCNIRCHTRCSCLCFWYDSGWTIWNLQVVVLRVSLHCKACEGKVRKHISKMQGEFTVVKT